MKGLEPAGEHLKLSRKHLIIRHDINLYQEFIIPVLQICGNTTCYSRGRSGITQSSDDRCSTNGASTVYPSLFSGYITILGNIFVDFHFRSKSKNR